jgi:hypothetical protein
MQMHGSLRRTTAVAAAIAGAVLVASTSVGARAEGPINICNVQTDPGVKCECTLEPLQPLQGAVGLGEVAKKTKDIKEDESGEWQDLINDPIKVVRGPANALYVIDHHHGARAWLDYGKKTGICVIKEVLSTNVEQFREELKKRNWDRLKDGDGRDITWAQMPTTLSGLTNDPYRTLAWMVRKAGGFCRALMPQPPPNFVEFVWADFFRGKTKKLPLKKVTAATDPKLWSLKKKEREAKQKEILDKAVDVARKDGEGLPGWNGKKVGDKYPPCPPDPADYAGIGD